MTEVERSVQGVYLAYPIDQVENDGADVPYKAIEQFEDMLIENKACDWVFDPGDAFRVSRGVEPSEGLARINRCAHGNADLVAAFLPAKVVSTGVPMEIDRAVSQGKIVVVFSDVQSWMLNYPGNRVMRFRNWVPDTLLDAVEWIKTLRVPDQVYRVPDPVLVHAAEASLVPTRTYVDDAGYDLYVAEDTLIPPEAFVDVPAGVAVALPYNCWGFITGRSSAFRKRGLVVLPGVIDTGYHGELYSGVRNLSQDVPVQLKKGERIAQFIVIYNQTRNTALEVVGELPPSQRGTNGFGSSGA